MLWYQRPYGWAVPSYILKGYDLLTGPHLHARPDGVAAPRRRRGGRSRRRLESPPDGLGDTSVLRLTKLRTAAWTSSIAIGPQAQPSLQLALDLSSASDYGAAQEVRLSQDEATWTDWAPMESHLAFTLDAGVGDRTVQAQFRDAKGNVSPAVSDQITLVDAEPPDHHGRRACRMAATRM